MSGPDLLTCANCGAYYRPEGACVRCNPAIKDSGNRQYFDTGSVRDTREGKGRFDLLPPEFLRALARHFENGAKKYGDRNWEKGQPLSRYLDSAMRHTVAVLAGDTDEPHAEAAAWNMAAYITTRERIKAGTMPKALDDMGATGHGSAALVRAIATGTNPQARYDSKGAPVDIYSVPV